MEEIQPKPRRFSLNKFSHISNCTIKESEMAKTTKKSTLLNSEILNLFNSFPIEVLVLLVKEYDFDISKFKDPRGNNILHLMVSQNFMEIYKFEKTCSIIFHS
mmetsp:Transcript_9387/g.8291  ORF Transcript_9387/g.8291 Transcript_9387/m.8291 type:complete len:103 (+) Transcript_9387:838-1146(+)